MIYRGEKCCAGCGLSGKVEPRRDANSLCDPCKELIELGKGVKKETTGYSTITLSRYHLRTPELYKREKGGGLGDVIDKGTEFHYVSDERAFKNSREIGSIGSVRKALQELLECVDDGKKLKLEFGVDMPESWWDDTVYVKTEVALAFFKVLKALGVYSQIVYDEGCEKGSNLLVGLNTGLHSLEDFEKFRKKFE